MKMVNSYLFHSPGESLLSSLLTEMAEFDGQAELLRFAEEMDESIEDGETLKNR